MRRSPYTPHSIYLRGDCRVWGEGFGMQGLKSRVKDLWLRVQKSRVGMVVIP